jgi:hypothetical protein
MAQAHEKGWNFILGNFAEIFGSGAKTVTGRSSY